MSDLKPPAGTPSVEGVEALAQYAPIEEIAAHYGVSVTELRRLPGMRGAIRRAAAKRRLLLRQAELKRALAGDGAMLKRLLGGPVQEEGQRRLAAYLTRRSK
jgi:hypothetical protein